MLNKIVLHSSIVLTIYGVICPYLISAKNTEQTLLGIFIAVSTALLYINGVIKKGEKCLKEMDK